MTQAVTLAELRASAYLYADERPGGTDSVLDPQEVDRLINGCLSELYELLISAHEDDGYTKVAPSKLTVPQQVYYDLPDDFMEIRGLELFWGANNIEDVRQIPLNQRNYYKFYNSWSQYSPKGYRMIEVNGERKLAFYPVPSGVVPYTLYYIPRCPTLTSPSQSFDGVNGWGKLVSLKTAIEMRAILQTEASELKDLYAEQKERIETMAAEREASEPKHTVDVHPEGRIMPWPIRRRPTA